MQRRIPIFATGIFNSISTKMFPLESTLFSLSSVKFSKFLTIKTRKSLLQKKPSILSNPLPIIKKKPSILSNPLQIIFYKYYHFKIKSLLSCFKVIVFIKK